MKKLMMALACVCALGAQAELPDCFTQVEYIESTRAQSINTGFAPTDKTILELDCTLKYTAQQALFSSGTWANNHFMLVTSGSAKFTFYGTGTALLNAALDHRYLIQTGDGVVRIKDLTAGGGVCSALLTLGNTSAITLFSANGSYNAGYRLHSCRITDNGTLVRDFIPCVSNGVDETTIAGLYDTVEDKFYPRGDLKKADFTVGPAVEYAGTLDVRISSESVSAAADPLGVVTGLKSGDQRTLTAPAAATDAFGNTYDCTGCRIYEAKYDPASGRMMPDEEIEGSPFAGASIDYTHGSTMRIAVWQYALRNAPDPDDFSFCVEFTAPRVVHGLKEEEFRGVPVLVRLQDDPARFSYSRLFDPNNGADIAFFAADGTPLPHEIDNWNTAGESTVWVKIPELRTGAKFRMYFGCEDETKRVAQKSSVVWSDYQAVWHMSGMSAGATADEPTITPDSTASGLDATVRDPTVSTVVSGPIGNALVSEDTYNKARTAGFVVPNSAALLKADDFTFSFWTHRTSGSWSGETLLSCKTTYNADEGGFCLWRKNSDNELGLHTRGASYVKANGYAPGETSWYYFTMTCSDGVLAFYKNATNVGMSTTDVLSDYDDADHDLGIGTRPDAGDVRSWCGEFDEVRWSRSAISQWRIEADRAMAAEPGYFEMQSRPHGNAHTVVITKRIPALDYDMPLAECHQTYMTDTNYVFTCSDVPRDLYFTKDDIAYRCVGYVFTPEEGSPIAGDTTSFTYEPATMGEGALEWQFAEAGYRARVHALPPFLADKAEISIVPDDAANHLFDCFYKEGTVLSVTLTEKEEGVFDGWRGAAGWALQDPSAKVCSYTVGATGANPDLVASVCGIVDTDDDLRLPAENCARVLATVWGSLQDGDDLIAAVDSARTAYRADGRVRALVLGAGTYTTSVPNNAGNMFDFPIVLEGGLDCPTVMNQNQSVQMSCWYNLTDDRAAFRRLTLGCVRPWGCKAAGLVSVAAGTLEGVTVTNGLSGADYNQGDGVIRLSGTGVITNSLVTNCSAPCPGTVKNTLGVIKMTGGTLVGTRITHCSSEGTASGFGGGVYMTGGTIRNCLIDNCTAYTQGSGLYVEAGADCTVENCTIADCGSDTQSSAAVSGVRLKGAGTSKKVLFTNNIVWGNTDLVGTVRNILVEGTASYSALVNNLTDTAIDGNFTGNPAFVDTANGDYSTGKGAGVDKAYDLAWAHGDGQTDIGGNPRILGEGLDVGCYEYVPSTVLDVMVDVQMTPPLDVGSTVTLVAEATGGAGGYVYTWFVNGQQVASGAEHAAYEYTLPGVGSYLVSCTVKDAADAEITKEAAAPVTVYLRNAFVAKTGSNTSPYDTLEKAATSVETVLELLDPNLDCDITIGPGVYDTTKPLMFGQKVYFHSTDGAEKTVIRPAANVGGLGFSKGGSVIEGITIEGMSGSAAGIQSSVPATLTNVCFRNCNTTSEAFVNSRNGSFLTTWNLSFHSVTNTGMFYNASTSGGQSNVDTHRNLSFVNCRATGRFIQSSVHGLKVWNGLFLGCQAGSNLDWSQNGANSVAFYNVTVQDCVAGSAIFSSNNSGNPYYLYNCVVGDVWTTTAKTARQAVFAARGMAHIDNSCFKDDVVSGTPALARFESSMNATDPRLKSRGRLKGSSPCLGKGATSYWTSAWKDLDFASEIDLVGNLRFHRAGVDEEGHPLYRIDMGCYENDPPGLLLLLK